MPQAPGSSRGGYQDSNSGHFDDHTYRKVANVANVMIGVQQNCMAAGAWHIQSQHKHEEHALYSDDLETIDQMSAGSDASADNRHRLGGPWSLCPEADLGP